MLQKANVKTIKLLVGVENKNLRFSFAVSKETLIFASAKQLRSHRIAERGQCSMNFSGLFLCPYMSFL